MAKIFLSCATRDFEPWREELASYLSRAGDHPLIQPDFPQMAGDTLENLDRLIKTSDAVIHLLGSNAGSFPTDRDVDAYLKTASDFATKMADLGNLKDLKRSYTQWEAYIALYRKKDLFVYGNSPFEGPDRDLMEQHRVFLKDRGRHANPYGDKCNLIGKILADLRFHLGEAECHELIDVVNAPERFGRGKVDELKKLVSQGDKVWQTLDKYKPEFLTAVCAHLAGGVTWDYEDCCHVTTFLIDWLAQHPDDRYLLCAAFLMQKWAEANRALTAAKQLQKWVLDACGVRNLTPDAVAGHCANTLDWLSPSWQSQPPRVGVWSRLTRLFRLSSSRQSQAPRVPSARIQIELQGDPGTHGERIKRQAFLRWGSRVLQNIGVDEEGICARTVDDVVETICERAAWDKLPFECIEVFVPPAQLARSWEYRENSDRQPWPVVLRLSRPRHQLKDLRDPHDPLQKAKLPCCFVDSSAFEQVVREAGAFFAASIEDGVLEKLASLAGFGLWLRCPVPREEAERVLDELDRQALSSLPKLIFDQKTRQACGAWRHLSILYDLPTSPGFPARDASEQTRRRQQMQMISQIA
jgi:hypothetical protein